MKPPDLTKLRSLDAYDIAFSSRLDWFDQGELCVIIPDSVKSTPGPAWVLTSNLSQIVIDRKLASSNGVDSDMDVLAQMNAPVIVTIHYVVDDPQSGVEFVSPLDHGSRTSWSAQALTEYANSSSWFPCRLSHVLTLTAIILFLIISRCCLPQRLNSRNTFFSVRLC